ncbi:MAG: ECF-type sigma factor [Myxococcota bacterium]
MDPRDDATRILQRLGEAEAPAEDWQRLLEIVHSDLHRVASALMARENRGHTLQPTALVNEAYLRLVRQRDARWTDRAHFLAVAASCMRRILVDHARAKRAAKRGGALAPVTLEEGLAGEGARAFEALALDQALDALAAADERAAKVAEMRLFGGMTVAEVAHALDVSPRTIDGDWATARLFLSRELAGS